MKINLFKKALMSLVLFNLSHLAFSQMIDSIKYPAHFGGSVTVTNNGISFIPTFYLGKPAVIFDLSAGKRLSFDPQLRFALEGKPWSFIFWWRYRLVNTSRFLVRIGGHPALSFSTLPVVTNGESKETIISHRYLAGELSPNYFFTNNISAGIYYLYSYGIDNENVRHTHYLMFNMNFSNIKLTDKLFINYIPQIYYLRINNNDGFNFTSSLTLVKRNFPVYISAFINKTIQSNVTGSKNFIWNASLIYTFNQEYVKR